MKIAASEELVDVAAGDAGIRLGQFTAPDKVAAQPPASFPVVVGGPAI